VLNRWGSLGCVVLMLAVAVTGCRSAERAAALASQPPSHPASSVVASAPVLSTCGSVPQSDGPLASQVGVVIVAPTTAASGSTLTAAVQVRSKTATTVSVQSVSIVDLLITEGGNIVGRNLGPSAGTGASFDATPTSSPQLSAEVVLSGCGDYTPGESLPDTSNPPPDATRSALPPGTYILYAVVEDDTFGELNPRNLVSAPLTLNVTPASTTGSSSAPVAVGDAPAIATCQASEDASQAALLAAGDTTPALTVAAGFNTTEGDAHRYADSIGLRPGDPSPRPAESSSYYTSATPVVACILDGEIDAPNLPGNPPYSREFALIGPHGILEQLVAGRTDTISLQNPSSARQ
jgi:hypothetical protein